MKKQKLIKFFPILFLFFLGCKTNFFYVYPKESSFSSNGAILALAPIEDLRPKDKKTIDGEIKESILETINKIIFDELKSTGVFKNITIVTKIQAEDKKFLEENQIQMALIPKLMALQWSVPDYDTLVTRMTVISILTGGLGGLIYGMTSTDVHGKCEMEFELLKTEKKIIYKSILGNHTENMKKLSCDTGETKAKMIGMALKNAMVKINRILKENQNNQ